MSCRSLFASLLFFMLLTWLMPSNAVCQKFLEPEDGPFARRYDFEFYAKWYDASFREDYPDVLARTVCIPFGSHEWAVSVVLRTSPVKFPSVEPPRDSTFVVIAVSPTNPTGMPSTRPLKQKLAMLRHAKIIKYTRRISARNALAIQNIFFGMVSAARYPESNRVGIDGDIYHFSSFKHLYGLRCGRVWSPDKGTLPARLVSLSRSLFEYAKADPSKADSVLNRLRTQIRDFGK